MHFFARCIELLLVTECLLKTPNVQADLTFPDHSSRILRLQDDSPSRENMLQRNQTTFDPTSQNFSSPELGIPKWIIMTAVRKSENFSSTPTPPGIFQNQSQTASARLWKVCGRTPLLWQRIVGGGNSEFGELPWMASLRKKEGSTSAHKCGAALLHPRWVITAAHCAYRIRKKLMIVRLGGFDFTHVDPMFPSIDVQVARIRIHPDFDGITFENDLALLQLTEEVRLAPHVVPICLAPLRNYVSSFVTVAGWGAQAPGGNASLQLKKVHLPVINRTLCEKWYERAGSHQDIQPEFICAGFENGGRDTCQGDSGGPLIQEISGRWAIVGIVSWGMGCARAGLPGVSTFLPIYNNWITEATENQVTLPFFYQ